MRGMSGYFATTDYVNAPLRAPATGTVGGNGVYVYSPTSAFPTQTFNGANYWVDVVFDTTAPPPPADTTPPTVSSVSPANGTSNVAVNTAVTATFSEAMNAGTITPSTVQLQNAANTVVPAGVSYNAGTNTVTLTPSSALANGMQYTATVLGGASGVKDVAGNALATTFTWSFTTAARRHQYAV